MSKIKKKLSYGELTELVLDKLADSLLEFRFYNYSSAYAILGKIIKTILAIRKIKKKRIRQVFYRLEKRELISLKENDGEVLVYLKEKGRKLILRHSIKLLLDFKQKNKKWDGRWFLVFFDVPEIQRKKRDYLRRFLEKIGFYRYQKSVYLFPYECQEEINLIKKIIAGASYMKYIIAEKIEDEEKIKSYFNLK